MWSSSQQYRLALEKKLLEKEMPQFQWYDMTGNTYLEGYVKTYGNGDQYKLRVVLTSRFPDEMPNLFVVSPQRLPKYGGYGTVNAEGASHKFHTLKNGPGGCVQVCHFKPAFWDSSKTLVAVLIKGIFWLEGYEAHLKTDKVHKKRVKISVTTLKHLPDALLLIIKE